MNKNIFNYLRDSLTLADYANLVEAWEVHRCADGAEDVFDLQSYSDFYMFAALYNLEYALKCQKKSRFWFAGTNYTKDSNTPFKEAVAFPATIEDAKVLVEKLINERYIFERKDIYGNWFDFVKYEDNVVLGEKYFPNYKLLNLRELEYPVVLQYFSVYLYPILCGFEWEDNIGEREVFDAIANMAYAFRDTYASTEWNTTFVDYMLHYAYKNATDYFGDFFTNKYEIQDFREKLTKHWGWYN